MAIGKKRFKHIVNIVLGVLLVISIIYNSIIQEYYKKDIYSLIAVLIGSIFVMSFLLLIRYPLNLNIVIGSSSNNNNQAADKENK